MDHTEDTTNGFGELASEAMQTWGPQITEGNMLNNYFPMPKSLALDVSDVLHLYIRPIVITVGLVGNLLTLLLMQQPSRKKSSTSVYFSTLSISDTVYLLSYGVTDWLTHAVDLKPWMRNDPACKLIIAVPFATLCISGWTVLALTIERGVVVHFPLKATILCTRRTAYIVTTAIALTFTCLWVGVLFGWGVSFTGECDNHSVMSFIYFGAGMWILWFLETATPIPMLVVANCFLMYGLVKSKRQRSDLVGEAQMAGADQSTKQSKATSRATLSAFLVSVLHVILTLPITVNLFPEFRMMHSSAWPLIIELSVLLRLINHSGNLFLYLVALPKIRDELRKMFSCKKKDQTISLTNNKTTTSLT